MRLERSMPRSLAALAALLLLAGCAGSEERLGTYDKTVIGAATGAVVGGVAGAVLDKKDRRGVPIGAAVGAAIGGGIGYLFDRQEEDFKAVLAREQEAGRIEVERVRDDLLKITMQNEILFDFAKADIKPAFAPTLDKLAGVLRKYDRSFATVVGHTDSIGSEAYNQALSLRRAEAVVDALVARGVPASRLSAVGRGESEPRADNTTEAGRQLNRRVEIFVSPQA
jgi:outer membrane protein OmpA-like peptidoglycan-associated protein